MPITERVAAELPAANMTTSYSILSGDFGREIQFQCTSVETASLLPVSEAGNGFNVIIRNAAEEVDLNIQSSVSEKIDGADTIVLKPKEWRWIRSDGLSWKSVAENTGAEPVSPVGAWELLSSETYDSNGGSGYSSYGPTGQDWSDYEVIKVYINGVQTAGTTAGYSYLRLEAGSSVVSGNYYTGAWNGAYWAAQNSSGIFTTASAYTVFDGATQHYNTANHNMNLEFAVFNVTPHTNGVWQQVAHQFTAAGSGGYVAVTGGGFMQNYPSTNITGFEFYHSANNISYGTCTIVGLRKS